MAEKDAVPAVWDGPSLREIRDIFEFIEQAVEENRKTLPPGGVQRLLRSKTFKSRFMELVWSFSTDGSYVIRPVVMQKGSELSFQDVLECEDFTVSVADKAGRKVTDAAIIAAVLNSAPKYEGPTKVANVHFLSIEEMRFEEMGAHLRKSEPELLPVNPFMLAALNAQWGGFANVFKNLTIWEKDGKKYIAIFHGIKQVLVCEVNGEPIRGSGRYIAGEPIF